MIGFQVLASGLRKGRFWAWVGSLCCLGLFVPTPLLPVAVVGLSGLLDTEVRARFGVSGATLESLGV